MKRLFIENDENLDFSRVKSYLKDLYGFKGEPNDFFDETLTEATFNSQDAWEAVKRNDEIFAESSLIDMMGVSGGLLFNNMMYMAIKENVIGKKVYFFSSKDSIWWDNLNADLFEKAFKENDLFTHEVGEGWVKIDIAEILKNM
jgi:hypothetical protein